MKMGKHTKKWLSHRRAYLNKHVMWNGMWVCAGCGLWINNPEVDHIEQRSLRPDLRYVDDNLQILCPPCHNKKHD